MIYSSDDLTPESQPQTDTVIDFGWEPSRRLPVYLLLDCSASMAGASIEAVNEGVKQLYNQLLETPTAVETVWISIITFGTHARQVTPLEPILESTPPVLSAGGTTSLGAALELLESSLNDDVKAGSDIEKGDWRPLIFLLTDGEPTDKWEEALARLKNRTEKKMGTFVALGCGDNVDIETLQKIADPVLRMENVTVDRLRDFFRWVSQSVSGASVSATAASQGAEKFPPLPQGLLLT